MSISDYQQTYIERIHQVVDYITEHISDEIVLDDLAAVACFSPFHLRMLDFNLLILAICFANLAKGLY